MDKYKEELERAVKEANIIPREMENRIIGFVFLGAVQELGKNYYYYRDPWQDKYYYESDFDREMRKLIKRNRFQNYAKK